MPPSLLPSTLKLRHHALVWLALSGLIMATICATTFVHHLEQLRAEAESTFASRSALLAKFVALHRDRVTVMRKLMQERYATGAVQPSPAPNAERHAGQDSWSLLPEPDAAGIASGSAPLPLSNEQSRELAAAMAMDAQIKAALQYDADLAWLYYLSAQRFIYIAPHGKVGSFHFSDALYERGYWEASSPTRNPARRMILKGPYQDLAGQGWIVTFAEPVYAAEHMLGVVAVDLRINTLEQLANVGRSLGETMMVSGDQRLIAKQSGFAPGMRLHPPLSHKLIDWNADDGGDLWLSSSVIDDELWLVHRLRRRELYLAAARESGSAWLMVLLFGLLAMMAVRLRAALIQAKLLMRTDPLTQALNRRGFYEKAEGLLALAQRQQLVLAVLIMDIDFFKKINDSHGHAVGDTVLKDLGTALRSTKRSSDLVCRWGGEEFVLLLPLASSDQALASAERLRAHAQLIHVGDINGPTITLSGGLVIKRADEPLDAAIKRADELLYEAKQGGRNNIRAAT
ncbi:diguanylate cyclase [Paucibacter sediminis]|uniref:diguanylate cyclase n=1 Tax=Paucibacter sediminis TaxID=3019553 RepID=A0AA95NES2_9BURK|nr:sensor domain-containing diguanylate cyclase [Paucibacter sp. S2-9]WIT13935.1 diguanylate cyclase [Paucibacter sp. S2-9]